MINVTEDNFDHHLEVALSRNVQQTKFNYTEGYAEYPYFSVIPSSFPHVHFNSGDDIDFGFIWGHSNNQENRKILEICLRTDRPIVLCEDGFLRSYDTLCNEKSSDILVSSCSLICDRLSQYYNCNRRSEIELILNDNNVRITKEQIEYSKHLIDKIVKNKLSKYNHQPIFKPSIGSHKSKVLVVDQSYGDFSIKEGGASTDTFKTMLSTAIKDNPDSDIIVKTHPDTMTGTRGGYYTSIPQVGRIIKVTNPINTYSLLDIVDKVYVCTTQFGLEALFANKEVHVFGKPIYSGWGMTIDHNPNNNRTVKRSIYEFFYIFYCMYTHWVNPSTGKICSIEEAIDWLIDIRDSQFKK